MKILLPIDGSELSLEAVRYAIRLTREGLQASFVIANVQEPSTLYEMVVAHDPEVLQQVSGAAGVHLLSAAEELLSQADLDHESEVASGDPAHTLVDICERFGCDAIIMGARGVGALSATLLGSVSQGVLRASAVPVTIVKPQEPPEAEEDLGPESSL